MSTLSPPILVSDDPALEDLCRRLADAELVAVDTESNSMHAYTEKVCLVQLSIDDQDFLVDPLAVDISPLGELFADPQREKILHAAEYDVMCLRRDYGFSFHNLFDTMLAARILGWPRLGLGSILDEMHGIKLDKRMQRHDWGRRPLTPAAIDYARLDTRFLDSLRAHLLEELEREDRLEEARAAFVRVARAEAAERSWDPEGYWQMKGARSLDEPGSAVLRELYRFREDLARRLDRPLFKVVGDAVLLELARLRPQTRDGLASVGGLPQPLVRRSARALLDAILAGVAADPPVAPRKANRGPKTASDRRFEKLRKWRREQAERRGVEPDVILGKREMIAVALSNPKTLGALERLGELDAWQFGCYGDQLVGVLAGSGESGSGPAT